MKLITKKLMVLVKKDTELVDITEQIRRIVKGSGIINGLVNVFTRHTTSAIRVNENEPLLMHDIKDFLNRLAPRDNGYRHDQLEKRDCPPNERINAHSHLRALLMGASECIPVLNRELGMGRWQSIFFVDLDGCDREREVLVQVLGE